MLNRLDGAPHRGCFMSEQGAKSNVARVLPRGVPPARSWCPRPQSQPHTVGVCVCGCACGMPSSLQGEYRAGGRVCHTHAQPSYPILGGISTTRKAAPRTNVYSSHTSETRVMNEYFTAGRNRSGISFVSSSLEAPTSVSTTSVGASTVGTDDVSTTSVPTPVPTTDVSSRLSSQHQWVLLVTDCLGGGARRLL